MAQQGDLLKILYNRIVATEEITLTVDNCGLYGYVATTMQIDGVEQTVYYKQDDIEKNIISYEIVNGVAITKILNNVYQEYSHIAPSCSSFKVHMADVDKEGSGRNSLTGLMYRERIGRYCSIDLTWDLIPNSEEYNRWYKILTHLPPNFKAQLLMPSGEIEEKEFYRADVSTELYLWTDGIQIWKGLSTSFIQWNVEEYDDSYEPI